MVRQSSTRPNRGATAKVRALAILLAFTFGVLLIGCGTSGRDLREPTAPNTRPRDNLGKLSSDSSLPVISSSMSLKSPAFEPGGKIPSLYTCDGSDISPPFLLSGIPEGTAELLLMITNTTDLVTTNWIVAKIPPTTTSFEAGRPPSAAVQIPTSAGTPNYTGPCPELKSTYDFSLYAFDKPTTLSASSSLNDVADAIASSTRTIALTGTYQRK